MTAMWIFVALLAAGVGMVAWALVGRSNAGAKSILADRLARGEITPDAYREHLSLIGGRSRGSLIAVGVALIVLGVIGAGVAGGIAMGRGEMGWMMGGNDMMRGMSGMMGGESGRRGDRAAEDAAERRVVAREFVFRPATINIPVNETTNITLDNEGQMFHTFTAGGLDFELRGQAGETISGSLRPSKTGTFSFVCTVPGHAQSGMRGKIVVEVS